MSAYQPVGALVGVTHTIDQSRSVYQKLSGPTYHSNVHNWKGLSAEEKSQYLIEEHEIAHHLLLSSTAAGMLEWRIAEVLHRDLDWLAREYRALGLVTPTNCNLVDWLKKQGGDQCVYDALIARDGPEAELRIRYHNTVVDAIKDAVLLEDTLYGYADGPHVEMTRRQFCDLFNRWNSWASKRSGLSIALEEYPTEERARDADHILPITTNDPEAQLFPEFSFNVSELIEAHATCQELWILEQHGDVEGAKDRLQERLQSPQGNALRALMKRVPSDRWQLRFSPPQAMLAVTRLLNTRLDIAFLKSRQDCTLEEILPWLVIDRTEDLRIVSSEDLIQVCEDLTRVQSNPIIGPHSQWVLFPLIDGSLRTYLEDLGDEGAGAFFKGLASLDVNRAIYTFKKAFRLSVSVFAAQTQDGSDAERAYGAWAESVRGLLTLIEYSDGALILGDGLFESAEVLDSRVALFKDPRVGLVGSILGSSQYHLARAYWYGSYLPHPEILFHKISRSLSDEGFDSLVNLTLPIYDRLVERIYRNTYLKKNATLYSKQ